MNCIPEFSQVNIVLSMDPNSRASFPPGTYLFAFKNFTRQVGWGIETTGKYFTNAAPSSCNQVKDGWPTPIYKESVLSHPYHVTSNAPWNVATFSTVSRKHADPFVNIAYYMARDPDGELGRGQMGSDVSLVGAAGSRWTPIDEKPSGTVHNTVKFN